ncbi:Calcium permeable stress-gated cation channel 1 [Grifola frondosa]|uniref:Calcium permeable stress-gated cation channel 1 n=1 Tax=Grifola frondosa TaxID=5627 RepID=A0A1C7MIX7_GRIFR|nr:Calcium permeable stress-gated cation channel 1 [Grifola frondosa]
MLYLSTALADPDPPDDGEPTLPPGSPPMQKFEGPWFETQLVLSTAIGLTSFLVFSYCRTRWPLLFAPRTKLKGFSPHEAHAHSAFFGWILPTIRTSEFTVLQIVGLDAAVLLNFYKMSFYLFSVCSIFAATILMPINLKNNVDIGDGREDGEGDWLDAPPPDIPPERDWLDLISDANSYLSVHLVFTYLFTILALRFIYKNFKKFIRSRQLFSLELVHSIPARTVMVTYLPAHLQGDRALAEYFEHMGLSVESVSICREVESLKRLLDRRTKALLKLESTWVKYLGNPSVVVTTAPEDQDAPPLVDVDGGSVESQPQQLVIPGRKRPTIRTKWFRRKVDALEYYEAQFKEADELVRSAKSENVKRANRCTNAHAPYPMQCMTYLAPEPRDIGGRQLATLPPQPRTRLDCNGAMCLLLFFWFIPISALASLLSYKEIKRTMPWLAKLVDRNEQIRAIVQNSLPSVAMITLNATLPFLLEGLAYFQGFPARSWIEYSIMKKYFLFLLINVVFIFLVASTYWQLVRDLANSPAKGIEKLADALAAGKARHFFVSYVVLQGMGIMPLQLLNLGVLIPRLFYRIFITRTPRDFAELNAPPMINYGIVYPQAILIFVITLLYSVIQPLILIFGAVYFGVGYVVYKYKLLFVFYKPYESQGQAWPITYIRLIWGVIIFILFMTGIFILKKSFVLATLLAPLLAGTLLWSWYTNKEFQPLSKFVSLSSVNEVQRGEDTADVVRLRAGHPVSRSQSNLNRRRYAQNDETLYVAPEDERTDYSQPPMANWYSGVLNTGKRRYGHPAVNGVLPVPWLPLKKGQSLLQGKRPKTSQSDNQAVVLTLRKKYSVVREDSQEETNGNGAGDETAVAGSSTQQPDQTLLDVTSVNPWRESSPRQPRPPRSDSAPAAVHIQRRLSYDAGSGVIILPEEEQWIEGSGSDSDEDYGEMQNSQLTDTSIRTEQIESRSPSSPSGAPPSKRYSTYYHHPERRRQTYPRS